MNLVPSLNGGRSSSFAPIVFTGKTVTIIGDSITFGLGASDNAHRFSTVLCGLLGATEDNKGISNSTIEKQDPIDVTGGSNMIDRLGDIPAKTSANAALVFAFGMNDWGITYPNYNTANFKIDFTTAINNAVTKGWPKGQILIVAPTYPRDEAFATYATATGQTAPTRARMLLFQQACVDLATTLDVCYVDTYDPMLAAGPLTMVNTDGIHPTDAGHALEAQLIFDLLTGIPAYNVIQDQARIVIPKSSMSFADARLTIDNLRIVYKIVENILSFDPSRTINPITGFEAGQGYYIIGKENVDLTDILVPPYISE